MDELIFFGGVAQPPTIYGDDWGMVQMALKNHKFVQSEDSDSREFRPLDEPSCHSCDQKSPFPATCGANNVWTFRLPQKIQWKMR